MSATRPPLFPLPVSVLRALSHIVPPSAKRSAFEPRPVNTRRPVRLTLRVKPTARPR